ncbi:MAG: hypothetical protein HFH87_09870, partial [Lachnospiraceae bacterium]|nr:hypothetical protein [Lachnospiraceae bacterium]
LRAPVMPDMTADRGIQRFTYSVMPFSGPFVHSRVTEEAYECNVKVTVAGFGGTVRPGAGGAISGENFTKACGTFSPGALRTASTETFETVSEGVFERASTGNIGLDSVEKAISFFHLEGGHVILETCKPAFDRKNGVVLRLYETKGCAGETLLTVPECVKRAFACNMLEETEEELALEAGKLQLRFRSFEIRTILLEV